jgi:sulfonate dioxygenase
MTTVQTITANHLIASATPASPYRYAHLLPHLSHTTYPPLTPFEHTDPGLRALAHSNPRSILDAATGTTELTPNLGTEVYGIKLAQLDSDSRDQLALEVPLIVFHTPLSRLRHAMSRLPSVDF